MSQHNGGPPGRFTFRQLHAGTVGLSGPERLRVFAALPASIQTEAWIELRERTEEQRARDEVVEAQRAT